MLISNLNATKQRYTRFFKMAVQPQYAVVVLSIEAFNDVKKENPQSLIKELFLYNDRNGCILRIEQELAKYDVQAGYKIHKIKDSWQVYALKRIPGVVYGTYKEHTHVLTYELVQVSGK